MQVRRCVLGGEALNISALWRAEMVHRIGAIEGRAGSKLGTKKADGEVERVCLSQKDFMKSTDFSTDFSYYPPYDGALWKRSQRWKRPFVCNHQSSAEHMS